MGQYELIFAIFIIVVFIYGIIMGIKMLLKNSGKSEKDIIKAAQERKQKGTE